MKNIFKLLVPAIIAIALFASCEDKMDEIQVKEADTLEETATLPRKDKIKVPPGYDN